MWRVTVKGALGHKLRLGLTGLAIVLGVAFVAGTYVLTDTLNGFFDSAFSTATKGADVTVRAASGRSDAFDRSETLPDSLVATIKKQPDVAAAGGLVTGYAQITDRNGKPVGGKGPPTLGFDWTPITRLSPLVMQRGRPPTKPDEVVVDAVTARKHHIAVGQRVKILFRGPAEQFTVVGLIGFGTADNLGGATMAAFEAKTAERVLNTPGRVDSIFVAAKNGVAPTQLIAELRPVLPPGVEAVTARQGTQEATDQIKRQIKFLGTAILFFAGIALFVGAFIIANTFSIVVAQRTRELGLLRAMGASGRQVLGAVLGEALLVGAVASVVGLGVGVFVGWGLRKLFQAIGGGAPLPGASVHVAPRTVIVSLVLGMVVTLLSSLMPARRAARLSPVEAMRDELPVVQTSARRRATTVAITVLGAAVAGIGLFGHSVRLRFGWIVLGLVLFMAGVARLASLVSGPLARGIGWPIARTGRVPGQLARANAARNPARTASTAAALMVGLGLVTAVSVLGASLRSSVDDVLNRSLRAELLVQAKDQNSDVGISPSVGDRLRAVPQVSAAVTLRFNEWRDHGTKRTLGAFDPRGLDQVLGIRMRSGSLAALTAGGVLVHKDAASRHHLRVGSRLAMTMPKSGTLAVPVVGIFEDREPINASYVLDTHTYQRGFTDDRADAVFVKLRPGVSVASGRTAIAPVLAAFPNVKAFDQAEFKNQQRKQIQAILTLVTALLALAVLIALLGIANTLALSIFERTRELGLLRAVGMTRRQLRRMIRGESVIIAVIGAALGLVVGVVFGVAAVTALRTSGVTRLVVPGGQLVVMVIVAAIAGMGAAIFPARRAARLDVLAAIATE